MMAAVSQFTLYGVLKGNKPDFHIAMPPQLAKPLYESLVQRVAKAYRPEAVKGIVCVNYWLLSVRISFNILQLDSSLGPWCRSRKLGPIFSDADKWDICRRSLWSDDAGQRSYSLDLVAISECTVVTTCIWDNHTSAVLDVLQCIFVSSTGAFG